MNIALLPCLGCFSLCLLFEPSLVFSQSNTPATTEVFRQPVAFETDPVIVKKIGDARDYIKAKRWDDAVEILSSIAMGERESLVPFSSRLFVNSREAAHRLLVTLPDTARATYRKSVESQTEKWFQDGIRNRDFEKMSNIVERAFLSRLGDDALLKLGQWSWQAGDVKRASNYWLRILPKSISGQPQSILRYPDSDLDLAMIAARCILCDLIAGNRKRAESSLQQFKKQYPQKQGTIAGKTGRIASLLDGIFKDAETWPSMPPTEDIPTFAGSPSRNFRVGCEVEMNQVRWTRPLPWRSPPRNQTRPAFLRQRHPPCFPVISNGMVVVNISDRVYAFDWKSGKASFPSIEDPANSSTSPGIVYPEVPGRPSPLPIKPSLGLPHFSATIHNRKLYVRLGGPITGRLVKETRAPRSELICYLLDPEIGRLIWKVDSQKFGTGWEFEGSPLVSKGRLFVAMRKRLPETQFSLLCLESRTGKIVWNKTLCTVIAPGGNEQNHISHTLVTLNDETVFLATHLGAIAALDRGDGSWKWLRTYPSKLPEKLAEWNHISRSGLKPCLVHQELLIAAPNDSDQLLAIDAPSGMLRWQRSLRGGVQHILGLTQDRLIVSGKRLWALSPQTGIPIWNVGYEDPAGYGFGRGLLSTENVYWPLREEVFVVNIKSGTIVRRIALRKMFNGTGGNLLIYRKSLLVAEPNRLVMYGLGSPKRKTAKMSEHPPRQKKRGAISASWPVHSD